MRVATWNLNLTKSRPLSPALAARFLEEMNRIAADVWVLTEACRGFSPGPEYALIAWSADAPDRRADHGECWVAVWSRLSAEPEELTADLERVAAVCVGGSVIVGTVLPWLNDRRHPGVCGEVAFRARLAEQEADWKQWRASAEHGFCVLGDFNQDLLPTRHYYGSIGGRQALRQVLANTSLECLTGDADDPLSHIPDLACIDHICVGGLRATGQPRSHAWPKPGMLNKDLLTDHYGVWADLEKA